MTHTTATNAVRRFASFIALAALAAFMTACGSNVDLSTSATYDLMEANGSGVTGTATFSATTSGLRIVLDLEGTEDGNTHPAHVHVGDVGDGGAIAITLNDVDGATGMSTTTVTQFDDGSGVNFDAIADYDGYVNVHAGPTLADDATVVATGEIGAGVSGR